MHFTEDYFIFKLRNIEVMKRVCQGSTYEEAGKANELTRSRVNQIVYYLTATLQRHIRVLKARGICNYDMPVIIGGKLMNSLRKDSEKWLIILEVYKKEMIEKYEQKIFKK